MPPARVTVITELSTVAGASWPAWPCAEASNPTASTAQSTSGTPRIAAICSSTGVFSEAEVAALMASWLRPANAAAKARKWKLWG